MYIAPIGVVNAGDPRAAYDEAILFATGHQQSYGLEAAGVLAGAIAAAFVPGTDIEAIVDVAYAIAKDGTRDAIGEIAEAAIAMRDKGAEHPEVTDVFHQRIAEFSPLGDDLDHTERKVGKASRNYQPSRFLSIEELPLALGYALVERGDFRKSIEAGVNSGRDTDSIGVMAGAILGALHGKAVINPDEASQIDTINKLDLAAEASRFAETARGIFGDDAARFEAVQAARGRPTPASGSATL